MVAGSGPTSAPQPAVIARTPAVLHELRALPSLPRSLLSLLALDVGAKSGRDELVGLIESWDLNHDWAVDALGSAVDTHHRLLLTSLRAALEPAQACETSSFPWKDYWRHNLAVAWAAELLAARASVCPGRSYAFAAGLLHDVGKWALHACFPRGYARVRARIRQRGECVCVAEHDLFGCDHARAGRVITTHWELPVAVVECAWLHHQSPTRLPVQVEYPELVRVVQVADHLARRAGVGFSGFGHTESMTELLPVADLPESVLREVEGQLAARVDELTRHAGWEEGGKVRRQAGGRSQLGALLHAEAVGEDERLRLAASCVTALARSAELEREGRALEAACSKAAGLVCEILPAPVAVVVVGTEADEHLHLGAHSTLRAQSAGRVVSLRSGRLAHVLAELRDAGRGPGWQDAPEAGQMLWGLGGQSGSPSGLKWVRLRHRGSTVGVVLADLTSEVTSAWQRAPDLAQALADVVGLTLGGLRARLEAEQAGEELLGQERRGRSQEDRRLRRRSLAMITEVAGGAAHEMNNPLAVISGRAQMLLYTCRDAQQARSLRTIVEQAQRAADIAQDLMGFVKPSPPQPVSQSLQRVLSALCQHWQARDSVRITLERVPADATVYADQKQLRAVLDAVLANALQAARSENARVQINSTSGPADDIVRIVVEDNGVGMEREVLEHALDPFFSSRPAGRGRGLGLSRAYRLVEVNGGRLWLESAPAIGTTVTLELPARPPQA